MTALFALALLAPQAHETVRHEFVYRSATSLDKVNLAGSFNNWNREATPMRAGPERKVWRVSLDLPVGKHYYKFVLNGDQWIVDPAASANEDDGGGNVNSVLWLLPGDFADPAQKGDGVIARSVVSHAQEPPLLNWDRGELTVSITTRTGDVEAVHLIGPAIDGVSLQSTSSDEVRQTWRVALPWDLKGELHYAFQIKDGESDLILDREGAGIDDEIDWFVLDESYEPIRVPGWVEGTVFYQIFPDRFHNGDSTNDPQDVAAWDDEPTYYNHMGGDLAGVTQMADYLRNLGVGAVYFNPIFAGPSNHRYETRDYFLVDEELGTNEDFAQMRRALRNRDIRVVLDGVFNHVAVDFPAFLDLRERGEQSRYADWFFVNSYPVVVQENPPYEAWWGFPSMPKIDTGEPAVREYFWRVVRHWQEFADIDGWRLDVANEVPMEFWREFRTQVKGLDSDDWILGEHWGDSSPWLKGDQWDAAMNYPFRDAVLRFIARGEISPREFGRRLMANFDSYAPQVSRNMLNLLGSHDTPRILTECGDDEDLAKLAFVALLTWPGAPCIYYGDELGMAGGPDPDNRRAMKWDRANERNAMLRHVKGLVAARNGSMALRHGNPRILRTPPSLVGWIREFDSDRAITLINRTDQSSEYRVPTAFRGYKDAISGKTVSGSAVEVPARGALVLVAPDIRLPKPLEGGNHK